MSRFWCLNRVKFRVPDGVVQPHCHITIKCTREVSVAVYFRLEEIVWCNHLPYNSDVLRTGSLTSHGIPPPPRIFANVIQIQYNACVEGMPKVVFSLLNRQLKWSISSPYIIKNITWLTDLSDNCSNVQKFLSVLWNVNIFCSSHKTK
jgi:hypothetical protein